MRERKKREIPLQQNFFFKNEFSRTAQKDTKERKGKNVAALWVASERDREIQNDDDEFLIFTSRPKKVQERKKERKKERKRKKEEKNRFNFFSFQVRKRFLDFFFSSLCRLFPSFLFLLLVFSFSFLSFHTKNKKKQKKF